MSIDKSIYWEINNICDRYAKYCKKNGDISFSNYYFSNPESKVIKKIYFKERFQKFISFDELSYIAKNYAEYVKNSVEIVYFNNWYDKNKLSIDRYMKIKKIEKVKEE